ncbi:MAG: TSUP family transporter [Pseudonocardiaceae bacterium]|nr:TSUP family transporter [Pseudonocardiaceae bacterium]
MSVLEMISVALAGVFAGTINTVVGSGTLVSFPVLLAVGYPPVIANISNGLGLVPGSVSGAFGYRRELAGQRGRLLRLGALSVCGGVSGAVLLLVLPPEAFEAVVPFLIVIALMLVILQPWVAKRLAARRGARHVHGGVLMLVAVFLIGMYGGYFGAAQGVLLLAVMGMLMDEHLQRINGAKNVLAALTNLGSGLVFVFVADVAWLAVALLAGGAILGGLLGALIGRRLPPMVLRGVIVLVGIVAMVQLLLD